MKKLDFLKSDWVFGIAVVAGVILFNATSNLIPSLERWAYDLGVRASSRAPSDRVTVIAIDDQSISNLGRWPWPRDVHAKMIDMLAGAQAKTVGFAINMPEPQIDAGLKHIDGVLQSISQSNLKSATDPAVREEAGRLEEMLRRAQRALNTDRRLADSIRNAGNVVLATEFNLFGEPRGKPDRPLPDYLTRNRLEALAGGGDLPVPVDAPLYPIAELGSAAAALGHINYLRDTDGGVRTELLAVRYYDQLYPSLALVLAARSLNLSGKDIRIGLGDGIQLGNLKVRTEPDMQMRTFFYKGDGDRPAFQADSFYDVMSGKIPASKYKDKIVLIGATATGVGTTALTPVASAMAPVLILAHSVSSILKEDFFVVPRWAVWAEAAVFLAVAAYVVLVLPKLSAALAFGASLAVLAALAGAHFVLMASQALWLQFVLPSTLLVVGYVLLITKRFFVTERGKLRSDAEGAESNRMLGLAFQGQGQLDMAFDKFRKLPLDNSVMDLLYNLALDYERKRQFNKAEAVYRHMSDYDPKYKDLPEKLSRAKAMAENVLLGTSAGAAIGGTVIVPGSGVEKPMLGRYQVEKELGKGAMGVVYLGRDPKIGRVVAIKTMALSQEFPADELADVKTRFFREAETAGRLNHPNIVTIYDAGEEQDLAYIAMEFLKGEDLVPHTKADNLLPLPMVLSIGARVAEALAYAHGQHVVHRDIKPANIMWEPETDAVKVTDFGIARITDSSKTRTGMVLGTPSYMSPEQLAGKKIEGPSDLFSLGVTLYQLACGKLPFEGEGMAQLMYKIANDPPANILRVRPDLPPSVVAVIYRAMMKKPEERFPGGDAMARALRDCAAKLQPGGQA
jgi:eukaryotic-like serine/threonine-protein kinase